VCNLPQGFGAQFYSVESPYRLGLDQEHGPGRATVPADGQADHQVGLHKTFTLSNSNMNWPVSILLGVLIAWVIIWLMNRSVSTFNTGLGDRLPVAEVVPPPPGPPPMEALEAAMNTKEPPFKRVQIEGTDALLVAVGLEEWRPRGSIMDGAPPGSMAQWLKTHEMGPTPAGPKEPKAVERDQGESMGGAAPPPGMWTGGGFSGAAMGMTPQSMGGFTGGFGVGAPTPSAGGAGLPPAPPPAPAQGLAPPPAPAPGLAPGPAPAPGPSVASAIAAWQAQQQAGLDAASALAQQQAIQQLAEGLKTYYKNTWLPGQSKNNRTDTVAARTGFLQERRNVIQGQLNSTPVSSVAARTDLFNQKAAVDVIAATNWADSAPVDCVIGDWGAWTTCTAPCGRTGIQTRTRVYTPPTNGGKACPATPEQQCQSCTGMRACVSGSKAATPGCPTGQTFNSSTGKCVLGRTPTCTNGFTFDSTSNKCKKSGSSDKNPTCDSGFTYNSTSKKCEASYNPTYSCADAGWKLSGSTCTVIDVATASSAFWQAAAPTCVALKSGGGGGGGGGGGKGKN
jgi:hypothetical protein